MVIPAAVVQAGKDADEALEALSRGEDIDSSEEEATLEQPEEEVIEQTPEDVSDETEAELSAEGQDDDEEDEEPAASGVGGEDYKQKYQTLMGKYNAEVPRLQSQISELQARMTQALTAQQSLPEIQEPEKPKGPAHARYLKKDELEDYGEDILDMQARMAKGVAEEIVEKTLSTKVAPYLNRINYLEQQLANSSTSSFWSKVEAQVDGAKQINDNDPLWFDFLDTVEPTTGITYREIGEHAYNSGDADRMATLMSTYLGSSTGKEAPKSKKKPPVKPGKVSTKAVKSDSKATKVYKESEIEQFYTDVSLGKFRGREEEMKKRESEIEQAIYEGRIKNG